MHHKVTHKYGNMQKRERVKNLRDHLRARRSAVIEVGRKRGEKQPQTLMGRMRALGVGQSLTVEARRASYAKMLGSRLGFELGRKYSSRQNNGERTLTMTRVE